MFVFRGDYCAAWRIRSSPDLRVLLGASAAKSDLASKGVVWRSCRTSASKVLCRCAEAPVGVSLGNWLVYNCQTPCVVLKSYTST